MDIRNELARLPQPDPGGEDRVWRRFQADRRRQRRPSATPWVLGVAALAAVGLAWLAMPEAPRQVALGQVDAHRWSDQVSLEIAGSGSAQGTDQDVEIAWESGTLTAEVEPESGTQLTVVTEEARVEVVGTVFSVHRDALGLRSSVERGKIRVTCASGESQELTPSDGAMTCLPVLPGALLRRADALADQSAAPTDILATLNRGVGLAEEGSVFEGELLARRMEIHRQLGRTDAALADADAYLGTSQPTRAPRVRRDAAWIALGAGDCERATPYLEALQSAGNDLDRVLLAECVAHTDPERARELARSVTDSTAVERAHTLLTVMGD